jgi:hypothetical protein
MIRYAYNTQMEPPAPFVLVTLRNPLDDRELRNVPAQLDTAADRTALPLSIAEALGLHALETVPIGSFGGHITMMPLYAALLGVHTFTPRLLRVLAHADEPWVLLGRDVLNEIRSLLDGPAKAMEIDEPA